MKKLKGYRFYVDFGQDLGDSAENPLKREWTKERLDKTSRNFNCIAIYVEDSREQLKVIGSLCGACAVYYCKNSACATSNISPDYLRINCTRISQELAKKLHPKLIEYLDE